jgi:hypothetical protein
MNNAIATSRHRFARLPQLGMVFAAAALACASVAAAAVEPFTARYQVFYQGSPQGEGTMRLARDGGNRWTYSLDIKGTSGMAALAGADVAQRTTFEVVDGLWRPLSSRDSSKMLFKKSDQTATYDWARGEARWSGDVKPDRAGPVRLRPGDLDGMLVNLALPRDLAAGRPLRYRMVDNGKARSLDYRVAGTETVTVDGRAREATKVVGQDGDRQIIAWVVEGLPVPARILQREKGRDALDLRIQSLR